MANKQKQDQLDGMNDYLLAISCSSARFGRLYARRQESRMCRCLWCSVLVVAVVVLESRVARCVHCGKDVA